MITVVMLSFRISRNISGLHISGSLALEAFKSVTPEESRRVDLANAVISGILQNKEMS
jgi:hypothetical protein